MRTPTVRTELMINFNVQALDQMDESDWVEPALAFDEEESAQPLAFDEDETHRAQVATAENLPLLNDAAGVEWQAGNGVATRESSERCVRQRI